MKSKKKLFISLFLVFVMLTLASSPVFSAGIQEEIAPSTVVDDNLSALPTIDSTTIDILSLNKNECMISEYVHAKDFNEASHVSRLVDEETLDTYVFLNSDGSKSVYYMDENVKYLDKNGNVQEKDISLVSKTNGYGIVRNEFDLHIPTAASSGINMSYKGYDVKIIPQTTVKTASAKIVDDSVVYDSFFGANTSLKYTPMLSGLKEDVIMKSYIPNASFSFILDTDGLGLYNDKGEYYLAESQSSKAVFNLGKVIIYDAIGKPGYGTMTVTTITEGQKYMLSLSAPEEFLADPATVYPVTIDPTLKVYDITNTSGKIEDAVLFSGKPSSNYGNYNYLSIGYVDSTYGVGRVAVKLPGLYNSSQYINANADYISSVKFYCWDTSGNSAQQVNLYRLTGSAWDENTVTNNTNMSYSTTPNLGTTMSNAAWTAFDITSLAKAWKTVPGVPANRGFILINSNETSATRKKAPYSSEYSSISKRPYVVMTYAVVNVELSCVNYFDSTFAGNTAAIQNIDYANDFSKYVYSTYFSVGITKDGAASQYDTIADDCTRGTHVACNNTCGTSCGSSHHKNRYRISNQLYNEPRESNHIYVLWTNRNSGTYCDDKNGTHTPSSALAVVYNSRPVIHFLRVYDTLEVQRASMALNLVHETAHTLNMDEAYNDDGHDTAGETHCVMEKFEQSNAYAFYQDVLNGIAHPFCSSCEASMQSHTSNISIPGN